MPALVVPENSPAKARLVVELEAIEDRIQLVDRELARANRNRPFDLDVHAFGLEQT